jgi:Spy/CpxP family protein refolding chaperone
MRLTLSMLGLLLAAGVASAQTPPADSPPPASSSGQQMSRIDRLAILLDLTDTQKLQVQQVLDQQRQQMRAFWQQQSSSGQKPDFEQMRTERRQLRQQTLAKLQTLLSAEQYQKLQVLMTPPNGRRWRHGAPPASSGSSSSSAG